MTTTITEAFEDAAVEALAAEQQTELEGEGFEKPMKTRRQLAEEFLAHFQADVEKAETALVNARRKLREAQELRDDAEENLRRAIREENGEEETASNVDEKAEEGDSSYPADWPDPVSGEVKDQPADDVADVVAVYPNGEVNVTPVGKHTRYAELVADYLADVRSDADPAGYLVYGEEDRLVRVPTIPIVAEDYGRRLVVCAVADAGKALEAS